MALEKQGLTAFDLTPEELRARWPKRLAAWFKNQLRNGRRLWRANARRPSGDALACGWDVVLPMTVL
jgi:hypothetical protein